jgi:hypothetical protein
VKLKLSKKLKPASLVLKTKVYIVTFLLFAFVVNASAQCAMCKAQLESNDGEVGNGINSGILYLMVIPYLLLTALVLVFFKGKIRSSLRKFFKR